MRGGGGCGVATECRMRVLEAELALDAHAELGEGPVWDRARRQLIWVDITGSAVHRFDPLSGTDERQSVGQPVGAAALRAAEGLVLALRDGFALLEGSTLTMIAATEANQPCNRMNDGKVDPAGRFWAGTMAFDAAPAAGSLYRLDPDHRVQTMLNGLTIANGLDWSPDGRTMYFIDSGAAGIDAFDYDLPTGAIANRRRLIEVSAAGVPDGMTVDASGHLWVALWGAGRVHCYTPDGSLAAVVSLPVTQVTSCAFGGANLDILYMTSAAAGLSAEQLQQQPHAGGVFRCRPGATGRAPGLFRG